MSLYFNGCSLTYGDELKDPCESAWPALVSANLKSNFLNDACSGGTNERTVYKTVQNINNYDYFFVAWTFYNRFTEYNPVDNFEINFTPTLGMTPLLHSSDDLKKNYYKYADYGKMYYKHWFNELYEFKKWLQQIIMLQAFFKTQNKKYLMLNATHNHLQIWLQPQEKFIESTKHLLEFFNYLDDTQLLNEHAQIQKLVSMIDMSTVVEWGAWAITDLKLTHPCGPNEHILESGHQAVANKVLEYYNKNL